MGIKNSLIIIFIFFVISLIMVFGVNYSSAASGADQYWSGLTDTAKGAGYDASEIAGESVLIAKVAKIIQIVLSLVGVLFLILMIYAGYTWMMAAGNEQQVEKARKILIASIIGMAIVLSAYAISYLVVLKFGNITIIEQQQNTWGTQPGF